MLGKPRILSLFPNSLNKFKKHEHSCKILYLLINQSEIKSKSKNTYINNLLHPNIIFMKIVKIQIQKKPADLVSH